MPQTFTISAYARTESGTSWLNKELNNFKERNNRIVGVLTSETYPSGPLLWAALLDKVGNFSNNTIPYAWTLSDSTYGARNSNGFAHGLSDVVNGEEDIIIGVADEFGDFYLGGYRVWPEAFE